MKITITGAAGFIGSHTAESLSNAGHDVFGIDNFSSYYSRDLKELNVKSIQENGVHFLEADLRHSFETADLLESDFVFHFAAQPGISDTTDFDDYVTNNLYSTYNLLEILKESKKLKLFVNIATSSIYGKHATDDEDTVPKPTSYYGVTKLAAEQLALSYNRDERVPATSLRLFSVYGPRERPEKLYTKLIKSIIDGSEFPQFEGSDKHIRSYTYVGDIVDAFHKVIEKYTVCKGEIINIGTDETITTGEGIKIIEEIMRKKANIKIVPKRQGDQAKTHANIEKAKRLLTYDPSTSPEIGLKKQVDWYLDNFVS